MVILKKIVIMTEYGKSNCSGIVKFENFAGRTSCFVRILGINSGVICIKCGEDVIFCGDLFEGEKRFNAIYDLNKIIQIAVFRDGAIVCLGSNRGRFSPNNILNDIHQYFAAKSAMAQQSFAPKTDVQEEFIERPSEIENVEEVSDQIFSAIDETQQEQEEQLVDETVKEEGQSQTTVALQIQESETGALQEEPINETVVTKKKTKTAKNETSQPFYKKIEDNMQELFEKNERDEELSLLIPDSKWVRVSLGDDGYYVVGIIYSEDVPNIICYGVPDKDGSNPPQSNENCRQWMEIEKGGRGYWMMYQSAQSGETMTSSIV
ncbi:MAG: hypothetical protein K2H36_05465 [Clostridia bacterium]|nr:hypothetical protein [Clostridia bacterium]